MRLNTLVAALVLAYGCKEPPPTPVVDNDGDGFAVEQDCDDADARVNPAAVESCDGVDENCDGVIDEGLRSTYYEDGDGDGYGAAATASEECERPFGYVEIDGDCDDDDITAFPGNSEQCDDVDHNCDGEPFVGAPGTTNWYRDQDGDGFGDRNEVEQDCIQPEGYVSNPDQDTTDLPNDGFDCDDDSAEVNPEAEELCATAFDDNCDQVVNTGTVADGQDFSVDTDGDGFGSPTTTFSTCAAGAAVDLDGDGAPDGVTVEADVATDCDDTANSINPNADEECDGIDNDCDPTTLEDAVAIDTQTWYADIDEDGVGVDTTTTTACQQPPQYAPVAAGIDCNDTDATVSPLAFEVCGDDVDNNCDGAVDDGDSIDANPYWPDTDNDSFGDANSTQILRCEQPPGFSDNDFDCDDNDPGLGAPPPVYLDGDQDGYGDPNESEISCVTLAGYVSNSDDCNDLAVGINPETYWYADVDGDNYGDENNSLQQCEQPTGYILDDQDCDDGNAGTNPDAADVCDGDDNDCDGAVDEDCFLEHCGLDVQSDEVWSSDFIHIVSCDVRVQGAAAPILTIEDGAEVRFAENAKLRVGFSQPGAVLAQGGPAGIDFRRIDDPTSGPWGGVEVGPIEHPSVTTTFENVTLREASPYGIYVQNVPVIVTDSTVRDCDGPGIELDGPSVLDLEGSTIQGNSGAGIDVVDTQAMIGHFADNVITGNQAEPIIVPVGSVGALDANTSYAGNGTDEIVILGGDVTADTSLLSVDADYRVEGTIIVEGGAAPELYVEDGVDVYFTSGSDLVVGDFEPGSINVDGGLFGVTFTGVNQVEGSWGGITLGREAGDSRLAGLDIEYGGDNGFGNIYVEDGPFVAEDDRKTLEVDDVRSAYGAGSGLYANRIKLIVTNSTFEHNLGNGADMVDLVPADTNISSNTFRDNADSGVSVSPNLVEMLPGNTFASNGLPVEILGGILDRNATWSELDEPYYLTGVVQVEDVSGPVLTLQSGVEIFHGSGGELDAGVFAQGSLVVEGADAGPPTVLFSSITEFEGLTSVRGSFRGPVIGQFNRVSEFTGLNVRWGGAGQGSVEILGSDVGAIPVLFDNVVLEEGGSNGLYAEDAVVEIENSAFINNDDIGIWLDIGASLKESPVRGFTDNIITGNGLHAMELPAESTGQLDAGSCTFAGNQVINGLPDRVAIYDEVLTTQTWENIDAEYWINNGTIQVGGPNRPTLELDPGVRITAAADSDTAFIVGQFGLGGGIRAVGTAAEPIVFTSDADYPGGTPDRGDWVGLELGADCIESDSGGGGVGDCWLQHVVIDYAGSRNDEGALMIENRNLVDGYQGPVYIDFVTIRHSGSNGLQLQIQPGINFPEPLPWLPYILQDDPTGPFPGAPDSDDDIYQLPACIGSPAGGAPGSGCAIFDLCFDNDTQLFGGAPPPDDHGFLSCDNFGANVSSRNFTSPFYNITCDFGPIAGDGDGPQFCP